jgi:hypothetical protein
VDGSDFDGPNKPNYLEAVSSQDWELADFEIQEFCILTRSGANHRSKDNRGELRRDRQFQFGAATITGRTANPDPLDFAAAPDHFGGDAFASSGGTDRFSLRREASPRATGRAWAFRAADLNPPGRPA